MSTRPSSNNEPNAESALGYEPQLQGNCLDYLHQFLLEPQNFEEIYQLIFRRWCELTKQFGDRDCVKIELTFLRSGLGWETKDPPRTHIMSVWHTDNLQPERVRMELQALFDLGFRFVTYHKSGECDLLGEWI